MKVISSKIERSCKSFLIFSKSSLFSFGKMKVLTPARIPPKILSSRPPIGVTRPCKLISPVIAILFLIFLSLNRLKMQVVMAVPADGPSLGTAPSGQ